ncbi:thioredoxin-disulfide reductase [candidate division WWE3 bacterium]|nr:thioredoxin-disulfide reductase [candidate division WWE3 bacterium]
MNTTNNQELDYKTTTFDVIIIGSGPAGLTAAIYTSRANLKTLILAGMPSGGQLMLTSEVENFPGFPDGIMGPDLMEAIKKQALRFGCSYIEENVLKVSGDAKKYFNVITTNNNSYLGKTVIVATGASAKWLSVEGVDRLKGKGVSACATCDGFFFKEKVVAVVGGGDSAMEESIYLTKFASKVYALVRGKKEELKASKIMQERAMKNSKIEFIYETELIEVLGENLVSGIKIKNRVSGAESVIEEVQGVFMAIGHKPNTDFLVDFLELDKIGYIKPIDGTKTSVEGIFVGGDVSDSKYRQAVSAAGFGCMAALDVEKFLTEK